MLNEFKERILNEVKKIASKNSKKGYVARFLPFSNIDTYSNDYGEEAIICVNFYGALEEMSKEYFDSNVYRLLAKQNASPKVSVDDALVGALDYNNKNIKDILYDKNYKPIFDLEAYYTLDGKFIANSYEEVEKYIDNIDEMCLIFKNIKKENITEYVLNILPIIFLNLVLTFFFLTIVL